MTTEYKRILKQVPPIVLQHGASVASLASRFFPNVDHSSVRFEMCIHHIGTVVVTEGAWLHGIELHAETTAVPAIVVCKDKNDPVTSNRGPPSSRSNASSVTFGGTESLLYSAEDCKNSSSTSASDSPSLLLRNQNKAYLVNTPGTFVEGLIKASELFPKLDADHSFLERRDIPGVGAARLTDETWEAWTRESAGGELVTVCVEEDEASSEEECDSEEEEEEADDGAEPAENHVEVDEAEAATHPPYERPDAELLLFLKARDGRTFSIDAESDETVDALKLKIQHKEGTPLCHQHLIFGGLYLEGGRTLAHYDITNNSTLHLVLRLRGGKRTIYLFPPVPLPSVHVSLTLAPQWTFSALYPVVYVVKNEDKSETVFWKVSADTNGNLVDLNSKLSLSYLFWEAHSQNPSSSALSSTNGAPSFDPSSPSLTSSNGFVLPFSLFLPYLDAALTSLSLHTAARTDFITYRLPFFLRIKERDQQVAFRFLPQSEYEQAAKLEVEPKPDVVTRVFLLFQGVEDAEAEGWRKPEGVDWVKEVGIEEEKVKDEGLFMVLECRGMAVQA